MKKWTLGRTGWAVCNGRSVFYIAVLNSHIASDPEYDRRARQDIIDRLNENERFHG